MAEINSSRFIVKIPCRSGGILYLHANPHSLYPPRPVSHASDLVILGQDVKFTIFMLIPRVETC